jgi:hypothetical protein
MGGITEADDDSLHGTIHPMLWKIAMSQPIGELARMVLKIRKSDAEGPSAVNSTMMVETAAEHRRPAEIAELVAEFDDQSGAQDLARLALDAAAARRVTETLAGLAGELVTYGLPTRANMLLAAVVRRRLPRDIARLLALLESNGQHELSRRLIDELAGDDGRVLTVLWLRAFGHAELAERVSWRLAGILAPADLAEFIIGLYAYHNEDGVSATVRGALGRDARTVAETIGCLHALAGERQGDTVSLAREVVRAAVHGLDGVDLFVLAGWLGTGAWKEGADIIWAEIVPGMAGAELVDKLSKSAERSGNPAALLDGLRKAASLCAVEDVALLSVEAEGKIEVELDGEVRNGQQIVLDTVAGRRQVADVFSMAQHLDDRGHGRVTTDLLSRLEGIVHEREEGAEAAQFIDRMLDRSDKQEPRTRGPFRRADRWQSATVLRNVVMEKKPKQLMALIAELTKRRRYEACRGWVERAVAEHYDGALLAELPLVLGHDYQPAVLHIILTAFSTPKWTDSRDIPAIVIALKEAGASPKDLHGLLTSTGGKRRNVGAGEIVTGLRNKGLSAEADWVHDGIKHPPSDPRFLP